MKNKIKPYICKTVGKNTRYKLYKNNSGVTLIELLIAIAVVGIIAIALATFITQGIRIWSDRGREVDMVGQARGAIDMMSREIRYAKKNSITEAGNETFEFRSDIYGDGDAVKIKYHVSGNTLYRTERDGTAYSIVNDVVNFRFYYYGSARNLLATPVASTGNIRYIDINLDLQENISFSTRVFLRNFREY